MTDTVVVMNEKIVIREARPEDYTKEKYEFMYQWLSEVSEFLYFTPNMERMEEDRIRFLELLKSNRVLVAVTEDGKIVGQCTLIRLNPPKLSHVANVGIAVSKNYQGRGIGKKLLRKAEEIAKSMGILKIEVEIAEENVRSLSLFRKMGYVQEGVRKKRFGYKGRFIDMILFGKFL